MDELISVIVPIYNASKYLDKCINSLLNQTYSNLEIILVNDGSLDNSLEICYKYKAIDNRIYIIDKKNTGVSNTRNTGIKYSNGKYIMFLDSDDYLDLDYINMMYKHCYDNNLDYVTSGIRLVNDKYETIKEVFYSDSNLCLKFNDIIADFINTSYFTSSCKSLFKKEIILNNNIKFNEDLKYGEDMYFSFCFLSKTNSIGYVSMCGYNYVQNSTSASHSDRLSSSYKYFDDTLYVLTEIKKQYSDYTDIINNRLFFKIYVTLLKIANSNGINYSLFKSNYSSVLTNSKFFLDINSINVNDVVIDSKKDLIFLRLIKFNFKFLFYILAKIMFFIKNRMGR